MAMARESQPVLATNSSTSLGMGVGGILGGDLHLVLNAGQRTQLGLNDDAVVMRILNDLAGDLDVPQRVWRRRRS